MFQRIHMLVIALLCRISDSYANVSFIYCDQIQNLPHDLLAEGFHRLH